MVLIVIFIKNGETLTKSVRHGRHRRVSGPDPVVLNSNGRMVKEERTPSNKKKIRLLSCSEPPDATFMDFIKFGVNGKNFYQ